MTVLGTKLHVPVPRRTLVPRPRLTTRLGSRGAPVPRLVLVSAPAGFGKTTLLTQWLTGGDTSAGQVAWLSLDEGDNEVRRFLTHLVAAARAAFPDVVGEAADLVDAGVEVPAETVLTALVNGLDTVDGTLVVALDDYHVIQEPEVHDAVTFLLEHLPPQATLAMATRADPPLPLPRLRARAELVEVRATDLRFTPAEAEAFLNQVMGLGVSADQVAALDDRTEGWAAGLQLAGLAMRGPDHTADSAEQFVAAFAGSHRFVLDYLVDEVLLRQPDEVRRFLVDTAVLDRMTGALCDALTGRNDGGRMLETLERENLFVVPLDDQRTWFRYHHLFTDALRARLAADGPQRAGELHRAARRWYAEAGLLEDAVRHALAGDDMEAAADLVGAALPEARRLRRDRVLAEWMRALPDDVVRRRPVLSTQRAWLRLSEGDLDGLEECLRDAEHGLAAMPPDDRVSGAVAGDDQLATLPAWIAIYRASAAQARGDSAGTAEHARRALELAGPDDHFARGGAAGFLGLAAWAQGDLDVAVDTFTESVASLRAAGDVTELGATVVLAEMWTARGRPATARRLYEQALDVVRSRPGVPPSTAGDLHVGLADALREQGRLEAAAEHLDAARALGETGLLPENRHRWHLARAGLVRARGDLDGALAELRQAASSYLPGFFPDVHPVPAIIARLRIAQGRLDEAWDWARDRGVTTHGEMSYLAEFDHLTLARLLIAQHRAGREPGAGADGTRTLADAESLLGRVVAAAHAGGRGAGVVEGRLLLAMAADAAGDRERALDQLAGALGEGVPAGYGRLFLDEGAPMDELLRAAMRGTETGPLAQTLLRVGAAPAAPPPRPAAAGSGDGLSERELEVLRLLASDLPGPEIARELFMSINTFRTHTRHIFTKLDVRTRRAAVARARDLALL